MNSNRSFGNGGSFLPEIKKEVNVNNIFGEIDISEVKLFVQQNKMPRNNISKEESDFDIKQNLFMLEEDRFDTILEAPTRRMTA
jgi:hypothetical protein